MTKKEFANALIAWDVFTFTAGGLFLFLSVDWKIALAVLFLATYIKSPTIIK